MLSLKHLSTTLSFALLIIPLSAESFIKTSNPHRMMKKDYLAMADVSLDARADTILTITDIPPTVARVGESGEKLLSPNHSETKDANEKSKSSKGKESIPDTIRTKNETIIGVVLDFAPSGTAKPTTLVYWSSVDEKTLSIPLKKIVDIIDGQSGQIINPYQKQELALQELNPNQEYRLFLDSKPILRNMRIISVSDQYLTTLESSSTDTLIIGLGSLTGMKDEYYLQQKRVKLARLMKLFAMPAALATGGGLVITSMMFGGDFSILLAAIGGGVGAVGGAAVGLGVGTLWNTIRYRDQQAVFILFDKYTNEQKRLLIQTNIIDKYKP